MIVHCSVNMLNYTACWWIRNISQRYLRKHKIHQSMEDLMSVCEVRMIHGHDSEQSFQVVRLIAINRAGWSLVLDLLHRLDYVH
jgi:hypothetical protein